MHPRRLIRDSVGFTATQYVVRAALMVRGVIAMHLLGVTSVAQLGPQYVCPAMPVMFPHEMSQFSNMVPGQVR